MKKFLREYTHIPAIERKGIIVLLSICCILIAIWFYLSVQGPKQFNTAEQQQFAQAADEFFAKNTKVKTSVADTSSAALFPFDPNTLDSAGFIALGLYPKTIHALLSWRRSGKHFYKPADVKEVYTLKPVEYKRLEGYIRIGDSTGK